MLDHVSQGFTLYLCPVRNRYMKVYSQLCTRNNAFIVLWNGCDFSHNCTECNKCNSVNRQYWQDLHLQHPDLDANHLTALQPAKLP